MNPTANSERSRKLAARPVNTGRPGALPDAPGHLSDGALAYWDMYVPALSARGVFEASDAGWLVLMCEDMAEVERLREALNRTDVGSLQYTRISTSLNRAEVRAMSLAREHAITPVGRLRAGVVGKSKGQTLLGMLAELDAEDGAA